MGSVNINQLYKDWNVRVRLLKLLILVLCGLFTSFEAVSQCSITAPAGTGNCSYGPDAIPLTASGSTGYYLWYSSSTGGSPIESGSSFTTPIVSNTTNYYVAATDTATGLKFDGTNDYVALDYNFSTSGALSAFTVEAWVKTSETGTGTFDNWSILDFDRSDYFNLFVRGDNGEVGFSTANTSGSIDDFYSTGYSVNDGNWHHIVGQYTGTDKVIFIDGIERARKVNPHSGGNIGKGSTRYGFIGDGSEASTFNNSRNNLYFKGEIDEVRLWSTARTLTQINDLKDSCLTSTPTGLVLYYPMNEGKGDSILNAAGSSGHGKLYNFTISSAWTEGSLVSCSCESNRTAVAATIATTSLSSGQLNCSTSSISMDAGSGYTTYSWNTGANTQAISATVAGIYSVTTTGGSCPGNRTVSVVGNMHSGRALKFDGNNDNCPIESLNYSGNGYTELTVECWLKTTTAGDHIIASFDRSEYWRLEINGEGGGNGQVGFDVNTNSGTEDFGSTTRVDDGKWHHIAAVFDNGAMRIYIDGQLDASTTSGTAFGSSNTRFGFLGVGSEAPSYNGTTGPNDYFNGELDEFRIWSVARTVTQIRESMIKQIPTTTTGLQVYYKFDELSGTLINDYETSNPYNANMTNFAATARVPSGAPVGDDASYLYTTSWTGKTVSTNSCDGESMTLSSLSGAAEGAFVYYVNTVPDVVTGATGIGGNDRYFGVFKVNGATATYTATYNYSGNPHIDAGTEPTLTLNTRSDGSATSWTVGSSTLDTAANTILVTAVSTEFVLGSSLDPLPIELFSFDLFYENNYVSLNWKTASEIDNAYFTIERWNGNQKWLEIGELSGAGNSNKINSYEFIDQSPKNGKNYYRIRQTDFNGESSYSQVKFVEKENSIDNKTSVSPNPSVNFIKISGSQLDSQTLKIYNVLGREINMFDKIISNDNYSIVLDISSLKKGSYILMINQTSHKLIVNGN